MKLSIFLLVCALSAALAYPYPAAYDDQEELEVYEPYELAIDADAPLSRVRRQDPRWQLQGGGGGSPRQGFDLSIDGRAPVWTSGNGRHSFDATGGYSQHLGGPWGNSPPQWRAGGVYTFRF